MRATAHRAPVDFRHTETRTIGTQDDIRSTRHPDATAQHKAMQRNDHRLWIAMNGPERLVVTLVNVDDLCAVGRQLLDIHPGTKTLAGSGDYNHPHIVIFA